MTKTITKTYEIMPGVNLSQADLRGANLVDANLDGMIIDDGEGNNCVLVGNSKREIK